MTLDQYIGVCDVGSSHDYPLKNFEKWKIIHGDCREFILRLPTDFDLIYADPPYPHAAKRFNYGEYFFSWFDSIGGWNNMFNAIVLWDYTRSK